MHIFVHLTIIHIYIYKNIQKCATRPLNYNYTHVFAIKILIIVENKGIVEKLCSNVIVFAMIIIMTANYYDCKLFIFSYIKRRYGYTSTSSKRTNKLAYITHIHVSANACNTFYRSARGDLHI